MKNRRHPRAVVVMAIAATFIFSGCGVGETSDLPQVTDARVGQPTGPNAALYLTARGYGDTDTLIAAATDAAETVEIHQTTSNDDGTMGMRPVGSLDLPADGELVLEPGGYHIMLIGADRQDIGAMIEVTLTWSKAGEQTIQAVVVDPSETMDHMDSDMDMEESGG